MKVISFQEMLLEYNSTKLETDDETDRNDMLATYKYSFILEGDSMELDNLEKWIKIHVGENACKSLYYGKIGYEYHIAEYFFVAEPQCLEVAKAVPNIYTLYPASYKQNHRCRTDGYDNEVEYNPENKDAIILDESK